MKANAPKRKIFDVVDMMTADAPQAETGNGFQILPVEMAGSEVFLHNYHGFL